MKWRYRLLILLFFMPAQTLFLETARFGGIKPDLALILVYLFGLIYGKGEGLFWGFTLGTFLDLFSVGILGVNFGLKAALGYFAGMLGRSLLNLTFWANIAIIFGVSAFHDLMGTLFLHGIGLDGMNGLISLMRIEIIPRAIYNSLVAGGLFLIISGKIKIKGSLEHAGVLSSSRRKSRFTG